MKVQFVAAGPIEWGSSRMRAWWIVPHMSDASVVEFKDRGRLEPGTADVYVWQKTIDPELIQRLPGRHVWDFCDPMWWWEPKHVLKSLGVIDGLTFSNKALMQDFVSTYPQSEIEDGLIMRAIPDSINLEHFNRKKVHQETSPIRFIWYGVSVNRVAIYAALANLERLAANGHDIALTICDDRPDLPFHVTNSFPIYHLRWSLEHEIDNLLAHDIALLPPYPGPWGCVKSINKKVTAWACGLPVWDGDDYDIGRTLTVNREARMFLADDDRKTVLDMDSRHAAQIWESILQ